ncbi:glycosyltransferase family 2 protein, partial [Conidiobolus coronatus NRRL 28638]
DTKKQDCKNESDCPSPWIVFSRIVTWYAPGPVLRFFKMDTHEIQQAWREKMALVSIIVTLCLCVGFLTFGLQPAICGPGDAKRLPYRQKIGSDNVLINGQLYDISSFQHPQAQDIPGDGNLLSKPNPDAGGKDLSFLFQTVNQNCRNFITLKNAEPNLYPINYFPCVVTTSETVPNPGLNPEKNGCHSNYSPKLFDKLKFVGTLYFTWDDIKDGNNRFLVYNGNVLDLKRLMWAINDIQLHDELNQFLNPIVSSSSLAANTLQVASSLDVSYLLANNNPKLGRCMEELLKVGVVDTQSIGCISSNIVLYVSLMVILSLVLAKFFMALFFGWVMGPKLGQLTPETPEQRKRRQEIIEAWSENMDLRADIPNHPSRQEQAHRISFLPSTSRFSTPQPGDQPGNNKSKKWPPPNTYHPYNTSSVTTDALRRPSDAHFGNSSISLNRNSQAYTPGRTSTTSLSPAQDFVTPRHIAPVPPPQDFQPFDFPLAHTLLLVTCYSEGEEGLRTTFDSLATTDYPSSHKLIYVVCDGIIKGSGNSESTPDICLSMMKDLVIPAENVQPHSYVAIADGQKRHNMAKVYAGYYKYDDKTVEANQQVKVPMVLVVKCGTPQESSNPKPGNRGKRDGQIILMSFLQRIMFDERLSSLDYEMFNAMWNVTGVTPDSYEIVLMVDADTKVFPDSLTKMVRVMVMDPQVMGLCGETKIANKTQSWVTMIQVFEYYISHHLSKAFESVFGGVTCLPGCFCMYRIKSPKGRNGYWVPILANPDIVEYYSENVVDTLHKKNLLLLGEDRYLTTLMLKTFPKRKMLFVPQAVCKTIVPDTMEILLSQRRRWINSTVHNLLELVLIRDLCGTFCFSMQFVIFMELIGTVVLPAAIIFTIYLIVISFFVRPVPVIPLLLLAAILGLPAVLIVFTTRKLVYVGWMLVYLLSLPIWNFILPVYAYWHFDDFSWGQTRQVEGEKGEKEDHGKKVGEFDSSQIVMKRWRDFERDKRLQAAQ